MKCVCCDKEVFLKPKVKAVFNEETDSLLTIKKREYLYESDSFIEYDDILLEKLEPQEKRIVLICDEKIYINKSFCEECYISFIKDKIDDLIESLASFRSKK